MSGAYHPAKKQFGMLDAQEIIHLQMQHLRSVI